MKYLRRFNENDDFGEIDSLAKTYLSFLVDSNFTIDINESSVECDYDIDIYIDLKEGAFNYDSFKWGDICDEVLPFILYLESGSLQDFELYGVYFYSNFGDEQISFGPIGENDYKSLSNGKFNNTPMTSLSISINKK